MGGDGSLGQLGVILKSCRICFGEEEAEPFEVVREDKREFQVLDCRKVDGPYWQNTIDTKVANVICLIIFATHLCPFQRGKQRKIYKLATEQRS